MNLVDEDRRAIIEDRASLEALQTLTAGETPCWAGPFLPQTFVSEYERLAAWNRAHYLFYRQFIKDWVEPGGSAIDIGCGNGARSALLSRYCTNVVGVDPSTAMLESARRHHVTPSTRFIHASWPIPPHVLSHFTYAFMVEVIEHIEIAAQPEFIDAALSALRPGGLLFLTTPRDVGVFRLGQHIGLWDDGFIPGVLAKYSAQIVEFSYLDSKAAEETGDPRSVGGVRSHYSLVFRR